MKETGIGRLFFHLDVKEFILGYSGKAKHAVLDLPYTSRTNGRRMMLDAMEKLRKAVAQHHGFIVMFYGTNANSRF